MTDFFKARVGPKPFLWLALVLGIVSALVVINWALFAAWMNAHPLADNIQWGYIFIVRASIFLVVGLLCCWVIVRLVRIYRRDKRNSEGNGIA